jgi:hypothetical protein
MRRTEKGRSEDGILHWHRHPAYLQNTIHALDAQRGLWNAIFAASFIPTFTLFGLLCRYVPLRTLL